MRQTYVKISVYKRRNELAGIYVSRQMTSMKTSPFRAIVPIIALFACTKSASTTTAAGNWQLIQKNYSLGPGNRTVAPSNDSSVLLTLNANGQYLSKLNNKVISQGSYSIASNASSNPILYLNNFNTTGIFALFRVEEIGSNGQVLSIFDGFTMNISNDTLTLSSALTPGGFTSYTFAKRF